MQDFVDFLRGRGKIAGDLPDRFHGHAYQLYERTQPVLCDARVLLVGDAAGLAYPQSGEGIRPAVESGLLAAGVIAAAGGDFAPAKLEVYARRLTARLGTPGRARPGIGCRPVGCARWPPGCWRHAGLPDAW